MHLKGWTRQENPLRLKLLKTIVDEWAKEIGPETLRKSSTHDFVGDFEVGEDGLEEVFEQLLCMFAVWGAHIPLVSKFRASCLMSFSFNLIVRVVRTQAAFHWVSSYYCLHGDNAKKKSIQVCTCEEQKLICPEAWADYNAGNLRARAAYLVRLWRKTPMRSKILGFSSKHAM